MAKASVLADTAEMNSIRIDLGLRTHEQRQEMSAWLSDTTRPGLFSHRPWWLKGRMQTDFFITDPNVALEFRMRWS
ncbi:MAG: hypothetical protein EOP84_14065 [Verrucomicrobiaceae bacterium]|nr:MAG: hypothetical protein EOP84_14065 [Verrucomicrobiaceae bacterium]